VVAEASDGLQAVDAAERFRPDVVLIEAESPNCDGIRATAMIAKRVPESRVVVLGESEEGETLVEALEAGARGYMSRESQVEELIEGIRSVYRGGTAVTATMVGYLVDRLLRRRREQDDARRRVYQLSPREREVLALLVRGGDNDGIAQALVISPQTARTPIPAFFAATARAWSARMAARSSAPARSSNTVTAPERRASEMRCDSLSMPALSVRPSSRSSVTSQRAKCASRPA